MSEQAHQFPCSKAAFASATLAHKIMRRDAKRKGRMNVYRCVICSGWHIGHTKPPKTTWKRRS